MNIGIINIGDELLIGQVVNTNASAMSRRLISAGIDVAETAVIPDNGAAIAATVTRFLESYNAVLVTGGLGPTKDDITKTTLCQLFHSHLVENAEALHNVERLFKARGYELTPINRQQAWVPECCEVLNNEVGTAPCMWFEVPGHATPKVLVSMPGVPFEMEYLMDNKVLPRLQQYFRTDHIVNKNLLVQGIGESFLSDLIESWELALPKSIRLAYLPQAGMVKLRLTARGTNRQVLEQQIADAVAALYPIAGQYIVGEDLETLPELVASVCLKHHATLATAESCTGGAIASKLTALAGASQYFMGSVVAYSNGVKENVIGVQHITLEQHGAVSEPTAIQMAEGVRQRLGTRYAIATTGIAGPGGGTPQKPVGTVWIAVASPNRTVTRLKKFGDDRLRTIERTANEAFSMLVALVNEEEGSL